MESMNFSTRFSLKGEARPTDTALFIRGTPTSVPRFSFSAGGLTKDVGKTHTSCDPFP